MITNGKLVKTELADLRKTPHSGELNFKTGQERVSVEGAC